MRPEVEAAVTVIPRAELAPSSGDIGPVRVAGEALCIPYRLYSPVPHLAEVESLPDPQRRILACTYTRHHDGFVRQRHLGQILGATDPWVVPFVVQLLGEYVLEIIQVLESRLHALQQAPFADFVRENPEYMTLTAQRVASYWNCYHRHHRGRYKSRDQYPGFRVLAVLQGLAK